MKDQVDHLVEILRDNNARYDEKEDAIMYLGDISNEKALSALIQLALTPEVVSDPIENDVLLDLCSESIAQIWIEKDKFDIDTFKNFSPFVQNAIKRSIIHAKPSWIGKFG
jgi:hypothetical protein